MYLAFILAVLSSQLKWSISKQACIELIYPHTQAWSRCLAGRYQPLTSHKRLSCPGWCWICKEPVWQHPACRWAWEAVREKWQDSGDGLHHRWRCSEERIWHVCFLFFFISQEDPIWSCERLNYPCQNMRVSASHALLSLTGSTDFGNVTFEVPGIHPYFHIGSNALNHTPEYTVAAGMPDNDPRSPCTERK